MDKPVILSETLEQLEQIRKQATSQVVKLPADLASRAMAQITGGKVKTDPLTGIEIPQRGKIQKLRKQEKKQKAAALPYVQQIIHSSYKPPKEPAGELSNSLTRKAPKLPPPVSASKPKWGTGERKGGISG